jgi:hypothetical protein
MKPPKAKAKPKKTLPPLPPFSLNLKSVIEINEKNELRQCPNIGNDSSEEEEEEDHHHHDINDRTIVKNRNRTSFSGMNIKVSVDGEDGAKYKTMP